MNGEKSIKCSVIFTCKQKHFTVSINLQCTNNNVSHLVMFYISRFVYGYEDLLSMYFSPYLADGIVVRL